MFRFILMALFLLHAASVLSSEEPSFFQVPAPSPPVFSVGADSGGAGAQAEDCPCFPFCVCGAVCCGNPIWPNACECAAGDETDICDWRACAFVTTCNECPMNPPFSP